MGRTAKTMPRIAAVPLLALAAAAAAPASDATIRLASDAEPITVAAAGRSVRELLTEVGSHFDLDVSFAGDFRDARAAVSLSGVGAKEALDRICAVAGKLWVPLDASSILVADDNPQNRRRFEPQVVQTFYLEHVALPDVVTLLRSAAEVSNLAAAEHLAAVTVRDTAAKVALIRELIARHDRAPAILEVDVRILRHSAAELAAAAAAIAAPAGRLPARLAAVEADELARRARTVARPTLSFADGGTARLAVAGRGGDEASPGLELAVAGRLDAGSGAITLEAELEVSGTERRELTSGARLLPGETWALSGLLTAAGDRRAAGGDGLVVLLTPRVAAPSSVEDADRAPLAAGTVTRLGLEPSRR